MNQKLITVLFVSVFYYGVTYSSPLDPQTEGMRLPEEKPPTEPRPTTEQINKKIETSSTTISPSNQHVNTSKTLNLSPQAVKEVTDPASMSKATEPQQRVTEKNLTENTSNKNESISSGKTSNESTAATSVPARSVTPAASPIAASTTAKSTTVAPAPPTDITNHNSTSTSDNKTSNITRSPESISTTTTTITTTTTSTTIKPSITTNSPVSAKDNVVEHSTPASIQEKHFDGQSFIGGMALTIGLTAIGFIAFKYYKSGKIDMNYRTF